MNNRLPRERMLAMGALILVVLVVVLMQKRRAVMRPTPAVPPSRQHYTNGQRLEKAGDLAGARSEWKTALALEPGFALPYIAIAALDERTGNPLAGAEGLSVLRFTNPSVKGVRSRQAGLYLEAGRYEKAMEIAKEAVSAEPNDALAHTLLGMLWAMADEQDRGIRELQTAHQLAPNDERTTLTLAQMLARNGRSKEALEQAAPELAHPQNPVQVNYIMGWLLSEFPGAKPRSQSDSQAIVYFKAALALDSNHPASNAGIGKLLLRQGHYSQARPFLERACQGDPSDMDALSALAAVQAKLGLPAAQQTAQNAASQHAYETALKNARRRYLAAPENSEAALALARLEGQRGDTVSALNLVKQVLQKDPNDPAALALMHRLMPSKKPSP